MNQVFSAVVAECEGQGIYIHLDNHVSKAQWCCSPLDGNSYWGDHYFKTALWIRGLEYMAEQAKRWPSVISMGLRNEIRPAIFSPILSPNAEPTSWMTWYENMVLAANAVHRSNPDLLVFLSGLTGGADLSRVVNGGAMDPGSRVFNLDDFPGLGNKLVLDLHNYDNIDLPRALGGVRPGKQHCAKLRSRLDRAGFSALSENSTIQMPVILTEFGWNQQNYNTIFARCLMRYIADHRISWMMWEIGGSYYLREGHQDADDSWGMLTHDWSAHRSPESVAAYIKPLVQTTLADESTNDTMALLADLARPAPRTTLHITAPDATPPSYLYACIAASALLLLTCSLIFRKIIFHAVRIRTLYKYN